MAPVKFLVVEDITEVSEALCEDLHGLEFCSETYTASSIKDASIMLEETPDIGCILVDWKLPDGEGVGLVEKLRASQSYGDKAIVMISANDDVNDILAAVRMGVSDYIVKPWGKGELKDKIGHALVKHARAMQKAV